MLSSKTRGFTLLEATVAVAIFGILSLALSILFKQANSSIKAISRTIEMDEALFLWYSTIDKDISAACIPALAYAPLPNGSEKKEKKEEKEKKIEKLFFCQVENQQCKLLTFITTHSLAVYNQERPKIVRVIYRLLPDPIAEHSFIFSRQEVDNLLLKETGQSKKGSYDILKRIKTLTISFMTPKIKENNDQQEFEAVSSWSSDSDTKTDNKTERKGPLLPSYIHIEGDRWNTEYTAYEHFVFEHKIIASGDAQPEPIAPLEEKKIKNKKTGHEKAIQEIEKPKEHHAQSP